MTVQVFGDRDVDDIAIAERTAELHDELLELDLESVEPRPAGPAPDRAKGDALAWAELLVGFSGGLPAVIGLLRSWTARNRPVSVRVSIDGDELELQETSTEQQERIVERWLARHAEASSDATASQRAADRD